MSLKQNMQKFKDLLTKISASLFASLMFTGLPNHFPLLTMVCNTNKWTVWLPASPEATIMDKSSWDTLRKIPRWTSDFSISNIHNSTSSPLSNVVTTWRCLLSVFQQWKGGRGFSYRQKRLFWTHGRTLIESVCFAQMCRHFCPWLWASSEECQISRPGYSSAHGI